MLTISTPITHPHTNQTKTIYEWAQTYHRTPEQQLRRCKRYPIEKALQPHRMGRQPTLYPHPDTNELLPISAHAKRLGITYQQMRRRLNEWPTDKALTLPVEAWRKSGDEPVVFQSSVVLPQKLLDQLPPSGQFTLVVKAAISTFNIDVFLAQPPASARDHITSPRFVNWLWDTRHSGKPTPRSLKLAQSHLDKIHRLMVEHKILAKDDTLRPIAFGEAIAVVLWGFLHPGWEDKAEVAEDMTVVLSPAKILARKLRQRLV